MKSRFRLSLFFSLLLVMFVIPTTTFAKKKVTKKDPTPLKEIVIDTVKIDYSQKKAPVVPFQDTIMYVYGNIGSITPQQRAKNIEDNIRELEEDMLFNADSLKIEVDAGIYLITYYGKTIIGVNDIQAEVLKKSKDELTKEYLEIITNAISKEKALGSWQNILKQVALSLLILIVTFLCIKYTNRGYKKLRFFIKKQKHRAIDKLKFILDEDKQIAIVIFFVNIIRFVVIIFILYFCLYAFFSLFPETKWLADTLIGYVISPLKSALTAIKNFVPDLFAIIVIYLLFKFLIKGIKVIVDRISDGSMTIKGFYPDWAHPTFSIVKVILYIFMIILIFPHLPGSNSPAFQGISVFLGVLFSLGSTSVIANIVSGIVITYMRPFKLGDRIKMGEFLGNVIEKTPLVTRIKTPKNEIITIPNGTIMSAQTVNYTHSAEEYGLILYTTVTMGYDIQWRKVHELLIEAGLATPNVLSDPKPFVLQLALDDFYVEYQINIYTREANDMSNIYSNLNKNVQDIFNREGIELLSPHFRAQRDGSDVNIPKEYIKDNKFKTPPFNMQVHIEKENPENSK